MKFFSTIRFKYYPIISIYSTNFILNSQCNQTYIFKISAMFHFRMFVFCFRSTPISSSSRWAAAALSVWSTFARATWSGRETSESSQKDRRKRSQFIQSKSTSSSCQTTGRNATFLTSGENYFMTILPCLIIFFRNAIEIYLFIFSLLSMSLDLREHDFKRIKLVMSFSYLVATGYLS